MILSNTRITKALIRLSRCAGWSAPFCWQTQKTGFLALGPMYGPLYGLSIFISSINSDGLDKSKHMYRVTRAFVDYIHKVDKGSDQTSFVDHFCYLYFVFCHAFLTLYCSLVMTCWERANLLALLCVMFIVLFHFPVWCPGSGFVLDCIDF